MKPWILFKEPWRSQEILLLDRDLVKVLIFIAERWEVHFDDEPMITCAYRNLAENRGVGAKSMTHPDWRAADIRVLGLSKNLLLQIKKEVELEFPELGAISSRTGKPNLIVYGDDDHLDHFHIQVRRK